jgi:predicted adenine nucleotide alpha hydrolase (AANH) superfamily ATPase
MEINDLIFTREVALNADKVKEHIMYYANCAIQAAHELNISDVLDKDFAHEITLVALDRILKDEHDLSEFMNQVKSILEK